MPSEILLSVALVTRNRPESLERCLQSWRQQTVAPFEIIVSDDSDDLPAGEIESLANRFGCRYTRGPRRGLYANRNHASLSCRGTHVASADDDHTHPPDYVEALHAAVSEEPGRVWVFSERHLDQPDAPLVCPPELHRSGHGATPRDPANSAAIADGSSVYPRAIFDAGLRYDETYPFGAMWYLWGQRLRKAGWRISFSDRTFIWHWCLDENRGDSIEALRLQMEAALYAIWVHALWLTPSFTSLSWALLYTARRMLLPDSIIGFRVSSRVPPGGAARAVFRALRARRGYRAPVTADVA